jgi:hypothetical protein
MHTSLTHVGIYLRAGVVYDITIPATITNLGGFAPAVGEDPDGEPYKNGFWIENKEVGEIIDQDDTLVKISYHHKLPYENTIWFVSQLGHKVRYSLTNVAVHDHATITTGGPAFGTYYSTPSPEGGS